MPSRERRILPSSTSTKTVRSKELTSFLPPFARTDLTIFRIFLDPSVYSGDIIWAAAGRQTVMFEDETPAPTVGDILIAKLRPGQVRLSFLSLLLVLFHSSELTILGFDILRRSSWISTP